MHTLSYTLSLSLSLSVSLSLSLLHNLSAAGSSPRNPGARALAHARARAARSTPRAPPAGHSRTQTRTRAISQHPRTPAAPHTHAYPNGPHRAPRRARRRASKDWCFYFFPPVRALLLGLFCRCWPLWLRTLRPLSPQDFSQLGSPGGGQASHQLGRGGRTWYGPRGSFVRCVDVCCAWRALLAPRCAARCTLQRTAEAPS